MALYHVLIAQEYSRRRELQESYLNIFYLPIFDRCMAYRRSKNIFGPNVIYCVFSRSHFPIFLFHVLYFLISWYFAFWRDISLVGFNGQYILWFHSKLRGRQLLWPKTHRKSIKSWCENLAIFIKNRSQIDQSGAQERSGSNLGKGLSAGSSKIKVFYVKYRF